MTQASRAGSSPHTRGARSQLSGRADDGWIIPAYAGSTWGAVAEAVADTDHPRIRGEHRNHISLLGAVEGSSPHTRGAHAVGGGREAASGIIPAYAGSTHRLGCAGDFGRDHPRIRGEHAPGGAGTGLSVGSSPHTRGARLPSRWAPLASGIIPAYAGSTTDWFGICFVSDGSSPHTRGAHHSLGP